MPNAQITSIVSPLVDDYITNMLEPAGYSCDTGMFFDNVDKQVSTLHLVDPESETGTYQFYKQEDGTLVVANYFDVGNVYGAYKDGLQFDADYDLGPVKYQHLSDLLDVFIFKDANGYIGVDSHFITHDELMKRKGWTDRRIKKEFGVMPINKLDGERYYRLNEVISKEQ